MLCAPLHRHNRKGSRTIWLEPTLNGKILTTEIRTTNNLREYFTSDEFELRYGDEITADEGLLSIPGIALVLPLAWLLGADIRVGCVDDTFAKAVEKLQRGFEYIYPKIRFRTQLIADEVVASSPSPKGTAMLFSGGMDASYTFFKNRKRSPRLIQVFGTEFSLTDTDYLESMKKDTLAFAKRNNVEVSFVSTNYFNLYDHRRVMHEFLRVRGRNHGSLWNGLGYSLGFLSITAPLSVGRFNHLLISAWANSEHADRMREYPDACSPSMDEKIAWSNIKVEHYGCLHRYEKARAMKTWLPGNKLRVCLDTTEAQEDSRSMNCQRCEKCARTITALAIGGVNPEDCGFTIDAGTIEFIKNMLVNREILPSRLAFWWGPMQRAVPSNMSGYTQEMKEFLEWFKTFDLGDGVDVPSASTRVQKLYSMVPYRVSQALRTGIYGTIGKVKIFNDYLDNGEKSWRRRGRPAHLRRKPRDRMR
jgi:hypothetical protein